MGGQTDRLATNPFNAVPKANEKADPRRQRRAMAETELVNLLAVARERPLLDALTVHKGPRKGERYADVRPEVRARLELLGRERPSMFWSKSMREPVIRPDLSDRTKAANSATSAGLMSQPKGCPFSAFASQLSRAGLS
jgi:hypothetical protein